MEIENLLREYEGRVQTIKKRFYSLNAIVDETKRVTGGKDFNIRNDIIWDMVFDSYQMLIIDLASLYKGMCKRGGFFGQLMAYADKLRLMSYRKINVPESDITAQPELQMKPEDIESARREVKQILQHHLAKINEDFFHWLFPSSKDKQEKKANQNDVDNLKKLFRKIAKEIITDRDTLRAHRYETDKSDQVKVTGVSLERIGKHFTYIEKVLTAIRGVTTNSDFEFSDINRVDTERTAQDIIDIAMMGSINEVVEEIGITAQLEKAQDAPRYYWIYREKFYEANPAKFGKTE